MKSTSSLRKGWFGLSAVFCGTVMVLLSGCRHSNESALDDRTLKDKPHVETVYPVDRADPFRP